MPTYVLRMPFASHIGSNICMLLHILRLFLGWLRLMAYGPICHLEKSPIVLLLPHMESETSQKESFN